VISIVVREIAFGLFITLCCYDRICRFGEIVGDVVDVGAGLAPAHLPPAQIDEIGMVRAGLAPAQKNDDIQKGQPQGIAPTMRLNGYGQIAYNEWVKLSKRFHPISN
jgi:hypothetical protein